MNSVSSSGQSGSKYMVTYQLTLSYSPCVVLARDKNILHPHTYSALYSYVVSLSISTRIKECLEKAGTGVSAKRSQICVSAAR